MFDEELTSLSWFSHLPVIGPLAMYFYPQFSPLEREEIFKKRLNHLHKIAY